MLKDPFTLTPAATGTSELRRHYARPLVTVLLIAGIVLLIACANIANLLLARATARDRELSVRRALGASRWRLAQQMLIESLLLSFAGTAAGLTFAMWGGRVLVGQLSTWFDRVALDVSLDWRIIAFTTAVSIATAVLFGTAPAIRAALAPASAALSESLSGRSPGSGGVQLRSCLVVAQIALSLVLLVAAGLFIRTFQRIATVPLGFNSERVLVVDVNATRVPLVAGNRAVLYQRMTEAVAAVPGATHAAASLNTPVNHGVTLVGDFNVLGRNPLPEQERRLIVNFITSDWFAAYGIEVRQGRVIDARDTAHSAPAVVVNEAFVRKFFPNRPVLGEALAEIAYVPQQTITPRTIVGVVSDTVDQSLRGPAYPTVYQPLAQWTAVMPLMPPPPQLSVSVRAAAGSPTQLARSVAAALTSVDSRLAFTFHPLADQVSAARQQERLLALLSGFFGTVALGLAAMGLYGVTSYAVARRRTEVGIRVALGAQRRDVVHLLVRQTAVGTAVGLALGIGAAAAVTRYLQSLLFGVTPLDPATFVAAPAILFAVALFACFVPARRAARIDPIIALRSE